MRDFLLNIPSCGCGESRAEACTECLIRAPFLCMQAAGKEASDRLLPGEILTSNFALNGAMGNVKRTR
jgi:hypothetical protein